MTYDEFRLLYEDLLDEVTDKLFDRKHKEYANKIDVLVNFKKASAVTQETPTKVNWMYAAKHYISILEAFDTLYQEMNSDVINTQNLVTLELVKEKITDMIGYLVLLYGLYSDAISNN